MENIGERIEHEVGSWEGVTTHEHRFGGTEFRLGRREIGHLHGDRSAHFAFPKGVWAELHEQGRIDYHPMFPDKPGLAARRIESDEDIRDVIELLRLNYDRAVARQGVSVEAAGPAR